MLGSVSEAEDVAQEALLRLTRQDDPIDEPAAWMTTVSTRLSINVLTSARARRESYVGPWLPEPLLGDPVPGPHARAELADSLSFALLVLMERLTPVERAAYLLRDVFGYEYADIAAIIERTEANSRQLVTRARKHLEAGPAALRPRRSRARRACSSGSSRPPRRATWRPSRSCSPRTPSSTPTTAARRWHPQEPILGAADIARFMAAVARGVAFGLRRRRDTARARSTASPAALCEGRPTSARSRIRGPWSVLTVDVVDGRIQTVRIVRNPDKLAHL